MTNPQSITDIAATYPGDALAQLNARIAVMENDDSPGYGPALAFYRLCAARVVELEEMLNVKPDARQVLV